MGSREYMQKVIKIVKFIFDKKNNYTKWRQNLLKDKSVREISKLAMEEEKKKS